MIMMIRRNRWMNWKELASTGRGSDGRACCSKSVTDPPGDLCRKRKVGRDKRPVVGDRGDGHHL